MDDYYQEINANTIPLIVYTVTSFIIVFISEFVVVSVLFIAFVIVTATLLSSKQDFFKVVGISIGIVLLLLFLSCLFSLNFTFKNIIDALPKSLSFSIMISTGIVLILYSTTYQLVRISKTLILNSNNSNPIYALLAGFRTVPVFLNFSKKIFTAIKMRRVHKSVLELITIYLQNAMMDFLDFLDSIINRLSYLDINKIEVKTVFNYKLIFSLIYLFTSILLFIYE